MVSAFKWETDHSWLTVNGVNGDLGLIVLAHVEPVWLHRLDFVIIQRRLMAANTALAKDGVTASAIWMLVFLKYLHFPYIFKFFSQIQGITK